MGRKRSNSMSPVEIRIQKSNRSTTKRMAENKQDKKRIIQEAQADPDVAAIFIGRELIWRRKNKGNN